MAKSPKEQHAFHVKGQIKLAQDNADCSQQPDAPLQVRAYSSANRFIGSGNVNEKGLFSFSLELEEVESVSLSIAPIVEKGAEDRVPPFSKHYQVKDWEFSEVGNVLKVEETILSDVWRLWWPRYICIGGKIRKKIKEDGITKYCPVPYVKVEIFDVDREFCLWPWLKAKLDVVKKLPVIQAPVLVKKPIPIPDPGPLAEAAAVLQPLNTQATSARIIEQQQPELLGQLRDLTISSKIAPWIFWPRCFYSKRLICSTTTDCNGNYRCCFKWWPIHFRNGHFRFDSLPDIIIKVTQVIDGVEQVIYLDPYTSVRWNSTSGTINLTLDNEEIICGSGCDGTNVRGTSTFFTRIGNDEVYHIDQTKGTYEEGAWSNVAYGGNLNVHAVFGDTLSSGANKRYYRLSIRQGMGGFTPINVPLSDTRVNKNTLQSTSYALGPFNINGTPNLYEVRDTNHFYWYNIQRIGQWRTLSPNSYPLLQVLDEGKYTLRLEVFDENGNKMDSSQVDYRDGTAGPGTTLPPMTDRCDLIMQLDNKAPDLDIQVPAATGACGVVKHADVPFDIHTTVNQENGRLYYWRLYYYKGLSGGGGNLASAASYTGLATPAQSTISSSPMTNGLTSTCAFSLRLNAWPLIRNGYGLIHHRQINRAVAVEKCNC